VVGAISSARPVFSVNFYKIYQLIALDACTPYKKEVILRAKCAKSTV
jgi:hypothetical protein